MALKFEVYCYIEADQDFYHASRLYSGLSQLAADGVLELRYRIPSSAEQLLTSDPYVFCWRVKSHILSQSLLLAIDLSDHSDCFNTKIAKECDIYLKRSYHSQDLANLSDLSWRSKVQPFGPNYAARSTRSTIEVLSRLAPGLASNLVSSKQRAERLSVLLQYWRTCKPEDYEMEPDQPLEQIVTFQTRVWAPEEVKGEDINAINRERAELVDVLRKQFGKRFRGGLYPSAYAREHFADYLSNMPSRHGEYVRWGKRGLVGVATRGLHDSLGFKFSEYMAASKCVVSEPLRNAAPDPLVEGRHYLGFGSKDECVQACGKLLENPKLAAEMRREAWSYYQKELKPSSHVLNCLRRATGFRDGPA